MALYGTFQSSRGDYLLTGAPIDASSKLVNNAFVKQAAQFLINNGFTFLAGRISNPSAANKGYHIAAYDNDTYTRQIAYIMFAYVDPDPPAGTGI